MGKGRKPKPTKVLKLHGTFQKCRRSAKEPEYKISIPDCPDWLGENAKKEWLRIIAELKKSGIIAKIYQVPLALYCQAYDDYLVALARIRLKKIGLFYISDKGNRIQSPEVNMMHKAREALIKIAVEFGLTPSAKTRVRSDKPQKVNPFKDMLKNNRIAR